jgi:N-formylglutamate amidohydrolase
VSAFFTVSGRPGASPVVVSVPHAGRDYMPEIVAALSIPLDAARALEDRFVDVLVDGLADRHAVVVAHAPRLMIDLNRAETDFLPRTVAGAMPSAARPSHRARGGLGLIPERLQGSGAIWKRPTERAVLASRIVEVHRPYHAVLRTLLDAAVTEHGAAVLLDLHSMPPLALPHRADVVMGDLHGRAAASDVVTTAMASLATAHLRAVLNAPYAGGHILERHGQPARGIHAIQIEIDRRLYLDAALDCPGPGLDAMRRVVARVADTLADSLRRPFSLAAE